MCGIVGYVGHREAVPVLVEGLEHLEYRGYDSAGIACLTRGVSPITVVKEQGKLRALKKKLRKHKIPSHIGIGHTRWATHGEPSRVNSHPHMDYRKNIALIHNGIIENYAELRAELKRKGARFSSQTDTEVGANLIGSYYRKGGLVEAFRKAVKRLHGFYAFVLLAKDDPDKLIVFRRSNPLCIGLGEGENFIASDVTPLLNYTNKVIYLEDDEYGVVTADKVEIFSLQTGKKIKRTPTIVNWNISQAQKGGYPHFMLKETYEQPQVLAETLSKRVPKKDKIVFDTFNAVIDKRLKRVENVFMVSCGTAYHAGLVGAYMIEEMARVPAQAQVSSEFRYTDPIVSKKDLVVFITQSGETADTLAAMREAKAKGALTLAVVNVLGSTIAREADAVIYTHAGPEIGVASTKAYTAQLGTLALFALYLAGLRKAVASQVIKKMIAEFRKLPAAATRTLKQDKAIDKFARKHYKRRNFLYLGRGYNFPTALEGALKLKEISYAHAHGYAAGEMKHGPIALIDKKQLVLCIAPAAKTYDKMISNIEEIRARHGIIAVIGTEGSKELNRLADAAFFIPKTPEFLSPILTILPLQLFAYKVSVLNGRDVDQPRNLAKSVTVE